MGAILTRREMVCATAATLAVPAASRAAGASEKSKQSAETDASGVLRFGFIGVGGRGTYLLRLLLQIPNVRVTAVCDINEANLNRALKMVTDKGEPRPAAFSKGPTDYRQLCALDIVDAVVIATPVPLHGPMAVDAMLAGKHVFSEVAAATTLDDCWALVETKEKTGRTYMMAENMCYMRPNMQILTMVQRGVFGECTYAECGYVHDCRNIKFNADGTLTWRGEMARDMIGNLYPTHQFGPVAQWLGINRTDRLVSLVAMTTRQMALERYAANRFGKDHPAAKIKFAVGDSTSALIQTANGVVIDIRYDTLSARPHPTTNYYALQGASASYDSDGQKIWIEGRSKENTWETLDKYAEEFDHPMWREYESDAAKTQHGGGDFFPLRDFIRAIRTGARAPVDVYDAATWSAIMPLTAASIQAKNQPVEVPDFTRGQWKNWKA